MYTIIISSVIGLIISVLCCKYCEERFERVIKQVVGLFFGCFIGFFVALFIPSTLTPTIKTVYLESLNDNLSQEGTFYLGTGLICNENYYTYYYSSDGGYRYGKIKANDVLIKYTNDRPRIEITKYKKTKGFGNNFSIYLEKCDCESSKIIYIPKGTILNNYTLDNK